MASAFCRVATFSFVISPGMRMARPGPGNGWRPTKLSGSPNSRPSARTSSLNRSRSGSPRLGGFFIENVDERRADDLALLFRIGNAREARKEKLARIGMHQRNVVVI